MSKEKELYLTEEGLEKIKEELNYLKLEKRPEIVQALKDARALGDLSENAEYDAARGDQAIVEARILELEQMVEKAVIIKEVNKDVVSIGTRVTIEYVMLYNVNDKDSNANELANLLRGMNVYVNLIPYNETNHLEFKRASKDNVMKFYDILKQRGINVTIRREFGSNIDAACGQLRSKEVQ